MFVYILKRILLSIPLVFAVLTLTFFLVRLAPGNPFQRDAEIPAEVRASLQESYGLNESLPKQYLLYLKNVASGDFGNSFLYKEKPVKELILAAVPVSAKIGLLALLFACSSGVVLGVMAAKNQNTWVDRLIMTLLVATKSIPPMVFAPLFVAIFALTFRLLPVAGWEEGNILYLIGPVFCLGLYDVPAIARLTRASLLEVIRSKHVATARARGVSETKIFFSHALKEALCPLVTYLAPTVSTLLFGTVVVEQIFNIPGLGRYLVQAATSRDYTMVLAISTFACVVIITFNLIADIVVVTLDPRIRLS